MNKRSTARLGFTATGALLVVLGSAMVVPTAASVSPNATAPAPAATSAAVQPVMWIDCSAFSWWERLWSSYC